MIDYNALREYVAEAAAEGRATFLPAGARDNATALILVDGEVVGEAVTVGHLVDIDLDTPASVFGERRLRPLQA